MDFDHSRLRRALAAVEVPVRHEVVDRVFAAEPLERVRDVQRGVYQALNEIVDVPSDRTRR